MCNNEDERDKATDESAVIANYIKVLEVEKLRGLMNGIYPKWSSCLKGLEE